jgi:hypothetical protein
VFAFLPSLRLASQPVNEFAPTALEMGAGTVAAPPLGTRLSSLDHKPTIADSLGIRGRCRPDTLPQHPKLTANRHLPRSNAVAGPRRTASLDGVPVFGLSA